MEWVPVIIGITVIILVIIFLIFTPKKSGLEDINACINKCEAQFEDCQTACNNLGPDCGPGGQLACSINESICNRACYPAIYAIRNGSVYDMNFYAANGNLLGNLSGWSPDKLVINQSDFPVLACYCNPVTACDCNNTNNGHVFTEPGCYILWYFFGGFYSTSEICRTG